LVELLVSAGIVAYSWLFYSLGARFINLYPDARPLERGEALEVD